MTATTTAAQAAPNRFAGPCHRCGIHVRAYNGELHGSRGAYVVRCQECVYQLSLASNDRGEGSPPANAPSNAAPAGEHPPCSERAALASVAMVRVSLRPGAPAETREVALELARLAIWASGSAQAASLLATAIATAEHKSAQRGVGADLVGEILDRRAPSQAPAAGTIAANTEHERVLVRCGGEDAGWLLLEEGAPLDRVMVRGLGELEICGSREAWKRVGSMAACVRRHGDGWRADGLSGVLAGRLLAVLHAWDDANARLAGAHPMSVGGIAIDDSDDPIDAGAGVPTPRTVAPPRKPAGLGRARGSRWAHLKKQ